MASSLILTGGASTTKTLKEEIAQTAHGFTVGSVLRWDYSQGKYALAKADTALNAEVVGVVNELSDANNFYLTYSGYIEIPTLSGGSYPVLFLSGTTAGELSSSPPSFVGSVVKPVLSRSTNGSGHIVMNYLGTQIGGSSTVAIDEIQPVGSVMPFAGDAIPDTWLECNGASYAVSDYAELYEKLRYVSGDRVPLYGYVARLNIAGTGIVAVGGHIQWKSGSDAWFGGLYDSQAEITARVIASEGSNNYLVQVLPNYSNGKFVFPSKIFTSGSLASAAASVEKYRYLRASDSTPQYATATISSSISIVSFNTPDLRARFPVGVNSTAVVDGTGEADSAYNSALSAFALGEEGGSESLGTIINVATWNATSAESAVPSGSAVIKPPYLATKYIIKAKPYTRAAIVDGLDIPYSQLLVRDLRTRNVGGSNGDLGIYTNTPGDAGNGTLRAVFTQGGTFAIGNAVSSSSFGDFGNFVLKHNGNSEIALVKADASGVDVGVALRCYSSRGTVAAPLAVQSGDYLSRISGFGWDGTSYGNFGANIGRNGGFNVIAEENFTSNAHGTALSFEFTPRGSTAGAEGMRFTSDSRLGIGTATPGASLDVNGTLKVGDFGGATNVMVKPNNTASAVGQVIPILRGNYITNVAHQAVTALPAGTWFVYLTAADNSLATQATDEDLHFCMAKVWTVPAGQFLRFGNLNKVPTTTDTTMGYWLDGSDTVKANATGFIEFKTTATGDAKAWQANGGNISATNAPSIFYDSGSADGPNGLINWAGYAIRIA